jgi:hypothetical protein
MSEKTASLLKLCLLALCIANVAYTAFQIEEVRHGSWASLTLFIYGGISAVLLIVALVALRLPGKPTVPVASMLLTLVGFMLFDSYPHEDNILF